MVLYKVTPSPQRYLSADDVTSKGDDVDDVVSVLTPDVEVGVGGRDDGVAGGVDVAGVVTLVVEVHVGDGQRSLLLVHREAGVGDLNGNWREKAQFDDQSQNQERCIKVNKKT